MKFNIVNYFKKYINYEQLLVCLIGSIGYGFGYQIPDALGAPMIVSLIICLIVGYFFDELARKIVDANPFFDTTSRKIKVAILAYLIYLVFWYLDYKILGNDLDNDLFVSLLFLIIVPIIGLVINMIKKVVKEYRKNK